MYGTPHYGSRGVVGFQKECVIWCGSLCIRFLYGKLQSIWEKLDISPTNYENSEVIVVRKNKKDLLRKACNKAMIGERRGSSLYTDDRRKRQEGNFVTPRSEDNSSRIIAQFLLLTYDKHQLGLWDKEGKKFATLFMRISNILVIVTWRTPNKSLNILAKKIRRFASPLFFSMFLDTNWPMEHSWHMSVLVLVWQAPKLRSHIHREKEGGASEISDKKIRHTSTPSTPIQ